jgi:cytochrome c oxidase assembly factor CtaG
VFIDLKNYNGKKQCLPNMLNFPLFIYLLLFIFLWLYFVGYVRMRTDCSNCSNFYELVYHYSAGGIGLMWAVDSAGEYVKPIALSQKAPQASDV